MSGLFTTLSAASTAIAAQSEAIDVTSNNIANINNPNYSVESVSYEDLPSIETADGLQSGGVTTTVTQARNPILDQMVRQEASLTDGYTAQQNILQQAQAALGESITNSSTSASGSNTDTTTESGLSAAIDDFFNAVQSYAADPTDSGEGQALVQQAGVLTDRFQQVDASLAQVQSSADSQVSSGVSTANGLLQDIASLNSQIVSVNASDPGSALTLNDQREGDLEQLAGLMPISVQTNSLGEDTVTASDTNGNPVTLVSNGTVSGSLSYANGTISFGGTALGLSSGTLQGTIEASVGPVQQLSTSLDQLAQQIVTSVNAAYNPTGASGGNFFDASGTTAATIALDPNLTAATLVAGTGAAGDNSIATAVANVANQQFSTANGDAIDGTIDEFYAGAASNIGQALDTANTEVTDQTNVQNVVLNQRSSVSGVSLDQEMSNLMTYQQAYQASSNVLQVIDEILGEVITDLGDVGS